MSARDGQTSDADPIQLRLRKGEDEGRADANRLAQRLLPFVVGEVHLRSGLCQRHQSSSRSDALGKMGLARGRPNADQRQCTWALQAFRREDHMCELGPALLAGVDLLAQPGEGRQKLR